LKLTSTRRDGGLFEHLECVQQNQITRLANKENQNKNKRPQRLLDKAGPLSQGRKPEVNISHNQDSLFQISKLRISPPRAPIIIITIIITITTTVFLLEISATIL